MPINITVELVQELMEKNSALLKQNEELTATIKELTQTIKKEMGILLSFSSTAIHDCFASYWKFPVKHAVCCAHLLGELIGVMENHPEQT